jgi:hypothetical protein
LFFLLNICKVYYIRQKMAELNKSDIKYIICSRCRCKYINNEDFGFNRLNKIYKTCVKCRSKRNKIQIITTNKILESAPILDLEKYNMPDSLIDIQIITTNKILVSAPILALKKYNMPDSLIDIIMSYQSWICNGFPLDVYSKYKYVIKPYKNYIRTYNYSFENENTCGFMGCNQHLSLNIKISQEMVASFIDNKIPLYIYDSYNGEIIETDYIASFVRQPIIKIKNQSFKPDKIIALRITIYYNIICHSRWPENIKCLICCYNLNPVTEYGEYIINEKKEDTDQYYLVSTSHLFTDLY